MKSNPHLRRWLRHMFLMYELRNMQSNQHSFEMFDRRLRSAGKMLVMIGGHHER